MKKCSTRPAASGARAHAQPTSGRPFFLLGTRPVILSLLIAGNLTAPVHVHSAAPLSCGLGVTPVVSLSMRSEVRGISLAGESATALVLLGSGLINGTDPLTSPQGTMGLHLLIPNGERWQVVQGTIIPGNAYGPEIVDLDGDGLDDLVVVVEAADGSGVSARRLLYFRQGPGGRLHDPDAVDLPDSVLVYHLSRTETPGRIQLLGRLRLSECLWAAQLAWTEPSGLHLVWQRQYCAKGFESLTIITWVPWSGSGVALVSDDRFEELPRQFTVRLDDGVWMESPLPVWASLDRPFSITRDGSVEVWLWGQRADSLFQLLPNEEGAIGLRGVAIEGAPTGWRGGWGGHPSTVFGMGSPPVLAKVGNSGEGPEIGFVSLPGGGFPRWLDLWGHAPSFPYSAPMVGVLRSATGSLQTLHDVSGALCLISGPGSSLPVDLPYRVWKPLAYEDLTGDRIPDLVGIGPTDGGSAISFFRGVPQSPWLLAPAALPLPPLDTPDAGVGDFDGDGMADLLCSVSSDSSSELVPLSFDGETLRPWAGGSVRVARSSFLAGDFDGDGRHEVLSTTGVMAREHDLVAWGPDRRAFSPVPMTGLIWNAIGVGDIDGDGRAEIEVWDGGWLSVLRCLQEERVIERAWIEKGSTNTLWDAAVLNLDSDPEVEVVWSDFERSEIWSYDAAAGVPRPRIVENLLRVGLEAYLGAADLNADGVPELLQEWYGAMTVLRDPLDEPTEETIVFSDNLAGDRLETVLLGDLESDGDPDLLLLRDDGIRIQLNETIDVPPSQRGRLRLRLLTSNPCRDRFAAAVRAAGGRPIRIGLFDVAGRKLWEEVHAPPAGAWAPVTVPQTTLSAVSSGVYWLQARSGGSSATLKIVLAR